MHKLNKYEQCILFDNIKNQKRTNKYPHTRERSPPTLRTTQKALWCWWRSRTSHSEVSGTNPVSGIGPRTSQCLFLWYRFTGLNSRKKSQRFVN